MNRPLCLALWLSISLLATSCSTVDDDDDDDDDHRRTTTTTTTIERQIVPTTATETHVIQQY